MFTRPLSSNLPTSVDAAVSTLLADLRLKDRTRLGSMSTEELNLVNQALGVQIARDFRLWSGNDLLLNACLEEMEDTDKEDSDPSMVIIQAMWEKLQETHMLRVVK